MEKILLHDIAHAIGCPVGGLPDAVIEKISTDSRALSPGCLFIALTGENFDGHNYVAEVLAKGAVCAVVMQDNPDWPGDKILRVKDTRAAYLAIAGLYRRQRDVKVVAVTGSVGKTTTKEMIACAVSAQCKTHKTQENLNNEIGLSQTILGITGKHRAAVLEIGMDGPGQLEPLARAARPDIAVVTNIGVAHIEAFPDGQEGIAREKLSIAGGVPDGGVLLLNADDRRLKTVKMPRLKIITYGMENKHAMVRAEAVRCFSTHTTFELRYNGRRYDAQIPTMGAHNVYNALAAFAVCMALDGEPHRAIAALRDYKPAGMRQKIVTHCGFTVVEDCYNASPDSMAAALATLGGIDTNGKRIMIMSDMLELGALAGKAHYDVGKLAAKSGIDMLLCTGELSKQIHKGATANDMENTYHFDTKEELFAAIEPILWEEDVVWLKASRGMQLEEVLGMIYRSNF
jgi:UDP-N-acetylmuramoyl-tripeptide--D-alanyl-D-alanine ligase